MAAFLNWQKRVAGLEPRRGDGIDDKGERGRWMVSSSSVYSLRSVVSDGMEVRPGKLGLPLIEGEGATYLTK
jgi:hypothetical protein